METRLLADPLDLRHRFNADQALVFDAPFASSVRDLLLTRAAKADFAPDRVEAVGDREVETPQTLGNMVNLFLDRANFREWIEQATGCTPVRAFTGRLAQTRSEGVQALDWHDDTNESNRRLGLVINLSDRPFDGGEFDLRRKGEADPYLTHHYSKPGEMMIFAVRPDLEHRVRRVTGGGPRRVFAGWFTSDASNGPQRRVLT